MIPTAIAIPSFLRNSKPTGISRGRKFPDHVEIPTGMANPKIWHQRRSSLWYRIERNGRQVSMTHEHLSEIVDAVSQMDNFGVLSFMRISMVVGGFPQVVETM